MRRFLTAGVAALMSLGLVGSVVAADFSPTTRFKIKPAKAKANPEVSISVAQNAGEEELRHVSLRIPAGFNLPGDAKIHNGERLGSGVIEIAAGPGCAGAAGAVPLTVPVNIVERDRAASERWAKAVWVVDLRPVTTIDLMVTGSKKKGWQLDGNIPQNSFTCPPFSFEATVAKKSSVSGTKIFQNPGAAGRYVFQAIFHGVDGGVRVNRQAVRIKR